jgi:hypothetical protein
LGSNRRKARCGLRAARSHASSRCACRRQAFAWRLLHKPPTDPVRRTVMGRPMLRAAEYGRQVGRERRRSDKSRSVSHQLGSKAFWTPLCNSLHGSQQSGAPGRTGDGACSSGETPPVASRSACGRNGVIRESTAEPATRAKPGSRISLAVAARRAPPRRATRTRASLDCSRHPPGSAEPATCAPARAIRSASRSHGLSRAGPPGARRRCRP